jgi:hypothetical protein
MRSTLCFAAALALLPGCPSSSPIATGGNGGSGGALACDPGEEVPCTCPSGSTATITCDDDGSGFGSCGPCHDDPVGGQGGLGGQGGTGGTPDPCGDSVCAPDEDCHSCEADCFCEPCDQYKGCSNAAIPPAMLVAEPTLNVALEPLGPEAVLARLAARFEKADRGARALAAALGRPRAGESPFATELRAAFAAHPDLALRVREAVAAAGVSDPDSFADARPEAEVMPTLSDGVQVLDMVPPGGTVSCGAPLLRMRVAQITVHEEDDDFANDIVYCAVSSEAAAGAEVRVTPKTPNLDEGDSHSFSLEAGVMWGQAGPRSPEGNLLVTYDCFEQDDNSGYTDLINAIGEGASQAGGVIGGEYGWILETVGALSGIVSEAVTLDGDDYLFNATQTLDLSIQLDLTNGKFWSVRKSGTHLGSDWDWELRIEAWGCAEYGTLP